MYFARRPPRCRCCRLPSPLELLVSSKCTAPPLLLLAAVRACLGCCWLKWKDLWGDDGERLRDFKIKAQVCLLLHN
jgi:hypothetical protein